MGIEIVHDHDDFLSLWEMNINQVTHTVGEIYHRAPVSDFDMPPRFQRREEDKQIAGAIPFIFIIILGQSTRFGRQWAARLLRLLFTSLVETNHGLLGIINRH